MQENINKSVIYDWKNKIEENELQDVINALNHDGIIIFPTDTVYGIGCNCFSNKAIKKIYEIKNRLSDKPICVLTDSYEKIKLVANNINDKEKEIIEKYMPGALTIILEKAKDVSDILTSNLPTVGVRIPNNDIALKILSNIDYPLATTSANISGNIDGIQIKDFINEFNEKVDIIIDGGKTDLQKSSTIVKVENECIKVIRQGTINVD